MLKVVKASALRNYWQIIRDSTVTCAYNLKT